MNNTELYINGKLVDTGGDLGVRLNRKLIDPGALNTVDAQYSYSISLPPTQRNNEAFNYALVEETKNKFNRVYNAQLIVNGVRIFGPGLFRLTSVQDGFKGQLYLPAKKTIKDIFGDKKLNQNAPYLLPFLDFAEYVNLYNNAAANAPQPAIFPYVLYGVLPKVPINRDTNAYSPRTVWDETVRLGIADLAPAVNPLIILKHIFNSSGYELQGTAFQDDKLAQLYQSYKNAPDYVQPWNYGRHAHIKLAGQWSNWGNRRNPGAGVQYEKGVFQTDDFCVDLFDATNTQITVIDDPGGNVLYKEVPDDSGRVWVNCQVRIPAAGFYKVHFGASIHVATDDDFPAVDPNTDIRYISGKSDLLVADMTNTLFELRLCRDNVKGDFGISGAHTDAVFYRNNQPQNNVFDGNNIPKYFPQVLGNGQLNLIDRANDENIALGVSFGQAGTNANNDFRNPKDPGQLAQMQAAKPALSWDNSANGDPVTRLAIQSPGYWKYGRIGDFDTPGENPNIDIDYSGGTRVNGKILDENGNPINEPGGNLDTRIDGYYLSAVTGFQTPAADWSVSDFIDLREFTDATFSGEVEETDAVAIVAYYDINRQFIGAGITADSDEEFTDEPIVPLSGAVFFRVCALTAGDPDFEIGASSTTLVNVILERFPLERYYTYTFTVPPGVTVPDYVYLFDGPSVTPAFVAPFIDGVATLNTSVYPAINFTPRVTLYLKTADYDIDGGLVISRTIDGDSENVVDWELSKKYEIVLNNAPQNYAKRARYGGADADPQNNGQGEVNAVIWFEAGELVTVAAVSSIGQWRHVWMHATDGYVRQNVLFDLEITPFRKDAEWLKVNFAGDGTAAMDWNDESNFASDTIDLVGFLDADVKTDDYIDNFCKTFNLGLSQVDPQTFSLDVKQSKTATSNVFVDLDALASVKQRENTPLGLPSQYVIGFTIDKEEEGYVETGEDGGGTYKTGATEENIVTQTSTFSYNWYKAITKVEPGGNIVINLPIISKAEAWDPALSYPDAMQKRYTDLAQRFMYYGGILPGTYAYNGASLDIANVRNDLPGASVLNYKNDLYTILTNYFTLLISGASHYTNIKGFITCVIYGLLDGSRTVRFNGDIYYIAEISAYDPYNRNQTTIKLIRKI